MTHPKCISWTIAASSDWETVCFYVPWPHFLLLASLWSRGLFLCGLPYAFIISHIVMAVASHPRGLNSQSLISFVAFPSGSLLKEQFLSRTSQGLQLRALEASWKSHSSTSVPWHPHIVSHELWVGEESSHRWGNWGTEKMRISLPAS